MVMTLFPLLDGDVSVYSIFVFYYIVIIIGVYILYDLMRIQYAVMLVFCACAVALTGFRYGMEPEASIRLCLVNFFMFDIVVFLWSGAVMRWQVKKRIKNPVNFPEHKK